MLNLLISFVLGLATMYIFKPLVDSSLKKMFKKNK